MTARLRANLLLLAVVMVWGSTFVLVKNALVDISPTLFNLLRMVLACGVLLVAYRPRLQDFSRTQVLGGGTVGACLAAGYQFQTIGLRFTTPSKSAFITGSVVVLVPLFLLVGRLFGLPSPRLGVRPIFGAALAFAGLALLTLPPGPSALSVLRAVNPGDWLTLGCAAAFALHILALGRASRFTPYYSLAILQTGFAAIFLAATVPLFEKPMLHWTPRLAFALAVTSLLATAFAFAVQSWAQTVLSATNTALLLTLEPVFAWLTSFLVLGERLTARGWAGAALVLAGILFTELRMRPEVPPAGAA
jgi:drug/metabolite transporter (DMT)-like permease